MADLYNRILLKKSNVSGKIPTVEDLEYGELAINYNDGILYYKNSSNSVDWFATRIKYITEETPTNPTSGELWWDPDAGSLFIFYDNGITQQWIEINAQVLTEGPTGTYTLNGNLIVTGDSTIEGTMYETSDINLKENIINIDSPLDIINKLKGVEFDWIKTGNHSMGLIAQELEQVLPFLVHENEEGIKTIHYTALIGLLIESIKELLKEKE